MTDDKCKEALLRLYHNVANDYVDEVWGRDYGYVAEALGVDLNDLARISYSATDYAEFASAFAALASPHKD